MRKLKKKKILKHFYIFLKKEKLVNKFLKNFTHTNNFVWRESYETPHSLDLYLKDIIIKNHFNLIRNAFEWAESEEGFDFWEYMSNKWENKCRTIQNKIFLGNL